MEIAREIANKEPAALISLIKALLRPLQSERMVVLTEQSAHDVPRCIDGVSFFFDLVNYLNNETISRYLVTPTPVITVNLSHDIVLPTAWDRHRYSRALAYIGAGKQHGAWKQDTNHRVSVWLPWGIGFVLGGNHSITSGILSGEGFVTAAEVYDLNPLFDLVESDGIYYRDRQTQKRLSRVEDCRRAAVFEIGRLMHQHGVCAFAVQ